MADDSCNKKPNLTFGVNNGDNYVPPPPQDGGTLDYSTSKCSTIESQYVSNLMEEALHAAAGPVNVFPLLGVHNQGSTVDQIGAGFPLSSGTAGGYNVADGFNVNDASWRSIQTGAAVTTAFIGYDFGTKKAWTANGYVAPNYAQQGFSTPDSQERYQPAEPIRKKISTIKIKQGANSVNRATMVRVEASDDGVTWHRVTVAKLPNDGNLNTISVSSPGQWNKWRIVPSFFNGVAANEQWEVVEIQMLEENQYSLETIQDYVLLENRDRSYLRTSTILKCQYDLLDVQTELAKFGINLPQTYIFTASFQAMVRLLGRPVIVGDIVELPGEVQYDASLRPVRKWLEVTDTGWSTEGYTMNWKPSLFRFYAQPIMPSVEHYDILGIPGQVNGFLDDADILGSGKVQPNDLAQQATEAIKQQAEDTVPQTGADVSDLMSGMPLLGPRGGYDGRDLYAEDAIPPNGAPYTVGDTLPDPLTIADGHYHRQTYTNVPSSLRPPERLLQWHSAIGRWKLVEINTRTVNESHKRTMSKIMQATNKIDPDDKP